MLIHMDLDAHLAINSNWRTNKANFATTDVRDNRCANLWGARPRVRQLLHPTDRSLKMKMHEVWIHRLLRVLPSHLRPLPQPPTL